MLHIVMIRISVTQLSELPPFRLHVRLHLTRRLQFCQLKTAILSSSSNATYHIVILLHKSELLHSEILNNDGASATRLGDPFQNNVQAVQFEDHSGFLE